jgi:flagellar hook assembly protein FlgD
MKVVKMITGLTQYHMSKVIYLIGLCLLLISQHASAQASVGNFAPDCSQATISPDVIWPPNEHMIPLAIEGVTDPENQPLTLSAQCVVQDEPAGIISWLFGYYDADGLGTPTPEVRAERFNWFIDWEAFKIVRTKGRVYEVIFEATDSEGAKCTGKANVSVPMWENIPTEDSGYRFPSSPDGVNCDATPYNNPPVILSQAVTNAQVNSPYQYAVIGHDPDQQDVLTYSLTTYPEGMVIDAQTGLIGWTPASGQDGVHTVTVLVTDPGSLTAEQTFDITVELAADELSAAIVANPVSGLSPLTVRFSPDVTNNNIVITGYAWDFNGDGVVDRSDSFGAPQTYTYTGDPGQSFTATLTVSTNTGEPLVATQVISIENKPPMLSVATNVTNGHAPLLVSYVVTASDPQGIQAISLDYDGDGVYDESVDVTGASGPWSFEHTYQDEGIYQAMVRVTDTLGAETIATNNAITVDVNNPQDPLVSLSGNPVTGNVPLSGTLTATAELFDGSQVTQWQWDLDGDGTFETAGGSALTDSVSFTYNQVNNIYPVVEVTTDSGRTARASILVTVNSSAAPTLTIPDSDDTLNSDSTEIAGFSINVPFETELAVWIENASGDTVQTIQPALLSTSGSYNFTWDGKNTQGEIVSEGDYYVVLSYTAFNEAHEVDLRDSTGGQLSYYRRTTANPRTFDRLEGPLRIDYAVDDPAEVSFFWQISFGERLMTLMEHERMGRGSYSLYWNGEYPSGQKIPSNLTALMPGIVRYALPGNVIFVKEDPRIEEFNLKSTIIHDPRREPIGIELFITKASTVEMVVSDMEKGVDVANRIYGDVPAGLNTVYWDGKNNDDQLLAPGDYRIGVRSVDDKGKRSLYWYRTQQIDY